MNRLFLITAIIFPLICNAAWAQSVLKFRAPEGIKETRLLSHIKKTHQLPDIKYNILGISNEPPKWNYNFYEELIKCKMSLNLSRGKPLKFTSSNRIAALIGNGIFTFIDEKTKFKHYFNENEVGFYKNLNDLGNKIEYMLSNPKKIDKYGKNGKIKYFKLFNNKIITKNIIENTF